MIRTIKTRIVRWKFAAIGMMFSAFFFMVACQEQVMNEVTDLARNSSMSLDYPDEIKTTLEKLQKENPDHKFVVLEPNDKGKDLSKDIEEKMSRFDPDYVSSVHVMKDIKDKNGELRSFVIVDYNKQAQAVANTAANNAQPDGPLFTVVEESANMPGGIEALAKFLSENLRYPDEARQRGIEGTVFVQFVVNKDGSLSNFEVKKGIDEQLNKVAVEVASQMPNWTPARQQGKVVRQQFVLPINFKLNNGSTASKPTPVDEPLHVTSEVTKSGSGKKLITGHVNDLSNNPVAGANIVLGGTTIGTVTNTDGSFRLEVPQESGELWVSFVGYKTRSISF